MLPFTFSRSLSLTARMKPSLAGLLLPALCCLQLDALRADSAPESKESGAPASVPAYRSNFEESATLPSGWTTQGKVAIDTTELFKGKKTLLLSRSPEEVDTPCAVVSPTFKMTPGIWNLDLACKADLKSPDNSFDGVVVLEFLAGGKLLDRVTLADVFAQANWQPIYEAGSGAGRDRFGAL